MHTLSILAPAAMAIGASALTTVRCNPPPDRVTVVMNTTMSNLFNTKIASNPHVSVADIDTYVHIIGSNKDEIKEIDKSYIAKQLNVLNEAYGQAGIHFNMKKIDSGYFAHWSDWAPDVKRDGDVHYKKNRDCKSPDSASIERCMKNHMKKGHYKDLNLYIVPHLRYEPDSDVFLEGTSTAVIPDPSKAEKRLDGVVIGAIALPGMNKGESKGFAAVHQVGHWLGLKHTSHGENCTGLGDWMPDTPAQQTPTRGCPAEAPDSCPNQPGLDDIHNFMDTSSDDCLAEGRGHFTRDQISTMQTFYLNLRSLHKLA